MGEQNGRIFCFWHCTIILFPRLSGLQHSPHKAISVSVFLHLVFVLQLSCFSDFCCNFPVSLTECAYLYPNSLFLVSSTGCHFPLGTRSFSVSISSSSSSDDFFSSSFASEIEMKIILEVINRIGSVNRDTESGLFGLRLKEKQSTCSSHHAGSWQEVSLSPVE